MTEKDYEYLDELYENQPKTERIIRSREPVNSHADMLKRTEGALNRFRKQGIID